VQDAAAVHRESGDHVEEDQEDVGGGEPSKKRDAWIFDPCQIGLIIGEILDQWKFWKCSCFSGPSTAELSCFGVKYSEIPRVIPTDP
jgi:hypothetical protein